MAARKDWVQMPHAGHFILGDQCKFRLNTWVGNYIVSTIGELWHDNDTVREIHAGVHDPQWLRDNAHLKGDDWQRAYMKKFGYEDIGFNRKYESMVFKARETGPNIQCCRYEQVSGQDVDYAGYKDALSAVEGHELLCKKWARRR